MYDGPKTVTFNAPPPDEAQHRSARLGSRIVTGTLGTASGLLALVALMMCLNFTSALATTWGELLVLGLVAAGIVAAMCGLPVAAAMMQRTYPSEASQAMRIWLVALTVVAIGAGLFAVRITPQAVPAHATAEAERNLARSVRLTDAMWEESRHCEAPRTLYQQEFCGDYRRARPNLLIPTDLRPGAVLGLAAISDGPARILLVLLLNLVAVGGAGLLGRLAVLATSESYRLGIGEAAPIQAAAPPPLAALPPPDAGMSLTPMQVFDMWFQGRVFQTPSGRLSSSAAFEDYRESCVLNGLPPMTLKAFGDLLTSKATASSGQISKLKSRGSIFYLGIAFSSERGAIDVVGVHPGTKIMEPLPRRT